MSKYGVKITTKPFRLAFPVLEKPEAYEDGDPKYSIQMIFEKDSEGVQEIRKALFQACKNRWGDDRAKWPGLLKTINFKDFFDPTGKNGFPVRDGDTVTWDGFAGMAFCKASCSTKFKPGVVDKTRKALGEPDSTLGSYDDVFGGLICRAVITCDTYEGKTKGCTCYLSHVQVLKDDGTRYSGSRAEDEFDDWQDNESGATGDDDFA